VLIAFVVCGTIPVCGDDANQHRLLATSGLVEASRQVVPFDDHQNQISLATPDGSRKTIKVRLSRVLYRGTLTKPATSGPVTGPGIWHCYELDSIDKETSYNWFIWSGNICRHFKLLAASDGDTYLTWVDSSILYFADVSKPLDSSQKQKQLDANLNKLKLAGVQSIEVCRIIGQDQFVDEKSSDRYSNIYLTLIEKDVNDGYRIQLHGNDSSKVYTLAADKGAEYGWRLE
jgi:hypothetical protein